MPGPEGPPRPSGKAGLVGVTLMRVLCCEKRRERRDGDVAVGDQSSEQEERGGGGLMEQAQQAWRVR